MPLPYIAMKHLWEESEWYIDRESEYFPELDAMMFGWDLPTYIGWILLVEYGMDESYEDMFDISPAVSVMMESWETFKSA